MLQFLSQRVACTNEGLEQKKLAYVELEGVRKSDQKISELQLRDSDRKVLPRSKRTDLSVLF